MHIDVAKLQQVITVSLCRSSGLKLQLSATGAAATHTGLPLTAAASAMSDACSVRKARMGRRNVQVGY